MDSYSTIHSVTFNLMKIFFVFLSAKTHIYIFVFYSTILLIDKIFAEAYLFLVFYIFNLYIDNVDFKTNQTNFFLMDSSIRINF